MNDSATLVVASFDGYRDIWPVFFQCKQRFWKDCSLQTFFISNELEYNGADCVSILTGKETNWCDRMVRALNRIPQRYIILLLEDYLIGEPVDPAEISAYLERMAAGSYRYLRLIDIPKANASYRKTASSGMVCPIAKSDEYGINLQPSIWDKEFLLGVLAEIEGGRSAWDFEVTLLKQAMQETNEPMEGCYMVRKNVLHIHNGVLKGKWFPFELRYFRRLGISIDTGVRPALSPKEVFEYRARLTLRECISPTMRRRMKKPLGKLGFRFASDI